MSTPAPNIPAPGPAAAPDAGAPNPADINFGSPAHIQDPRQAGAPDSDAPDPGGIRWQYPDAKAAQPASWQSYAVEAAKNFGRGAFAAYDIGVSGASEKQTAAESEAIFGPQKQLPPIADEKNPVTGEIEDWLVRKAPGIVGGVLSPSPTGIEGAAVKGTLGAARAADKLAPSTLGLKTGSASLQAFEKTIAATPGGGKLVRAMQAQEQQVGNSAAELANSLAGGRELSATRAGETIEKGMKARVQAHREEGEELYREVDRLAGPDLPVHMQSTLKAFEERVTPPRPGVGATHDPLTGRPAVGTPGTETMETVSDKELMRIHEGLVRDVEEHGYLPYAHAQFIRQQIGAKIQTGVFATGAQNGLYKKIYAAMSSDMMRSAAAKSDEAAAAVRRANTRWSEIKQEQRVLNQVLKNNGGPERVFQALMTSGERRRWGGGATTIRRVMDALPQRDRQLMAASAISEMGMSVPSKTSPGRTFSVDTFLTNWSRISPEAREAMFGEQVLGNKYAQDMSLLVMNVDALKSYGKLLANYSGTTPQMVAVGEATSVLTAAFTGNFKTAAALAALPAASWGAAAALTNPETVKFLADRTGAMLVQTVRAGVKGRAGASVGAPEQPPPDFSDFKEVTP